MGQVDSGMASKGDSPGSNFRYHPNKAYSRVTKPSQLNPVAEQQQSSAKKSSVKIGLFLSCPIFALNGFSELDDQNGYPILSTENTKQYCQAY